MTPTTQLTASQQTFVREVTEEKKQKSWQELLIQTRYIFGRFKPAEVSLLHAVRVSGCRKSQAVRNRLNHGTGGHHAQQHHESMSTLEKNLQRLARGGFIKNANPHAEPLFEDIGTGPWSLTSRGQTAVALIPKPVTTELLDD